MTRGWPSCAPRSSPTAAGSAKPAPCSRRPATRTPSLDLWLNLIALAERRGKGEDVPALLDAAEKKLGDRVEFRLARARNLATRGGPDVARKLQALGGSLDKFSPVERGTLMRGLAELLARNGDFADALALWVGHSDRHPRDLKGELFAFDLALASGDVPAQDRALKQMGALEGEDNSLSLYCRARQTIAKARRGNAAALTAELQEARKNLESAGLRRKTWEKVPLALAEIDELQGKTDAAIGHAVEAIKLGERDPGVIRRTLRLLADNKRFDQANSLLEQLQEQSSIAGDVQRLASELQYQNRDYESALKIAEKAVESGSTDYRDHLWLSQMRWIVGRRAEAEAPMRRAVELAGDDLTPVVNLVQLLVASGKRAEAERAIAEAEKKTSAKDSLPILERCYEAINRTDRAIALYQQALKDTPDDASLQRAFISFQIRVGRSKEAEPYLKELIKLESRSPADADWARRVLALLLASSIDKERSQTPSSSWAWGAQKSETMRRWLPSRSTACAPRPGSSPCSRPRGRARRRSGSSRKSCDANQAPRKSVSFWPGSSRSRGTGPRRTPRCAG